jgi:hypothetical protein
MSVHSTHTKADLVRCCIHLIGVPPVCVVKYTTRHIPHMSRSCFFFQYMTHSTKNHEDFQHRRLSRRRYIGISRHSFQRCERWFEGGTSGAQRVAGGGTPSPREHRVSKTSLLSYDIVVDLFPFSGSHKIERSFLLAIGHTVCSKEVAGIERQTHKSAVTWT